MIETNKFLIEFLQSRLLHNVDVLEYQIAKEPYEDTLFLRIRFTPKLITSPPDGHSVTAVLKALLEDD